MSGESPRHHEETPSQPMPAGAKTGAQNKANEDRVGPYGGDDGALEHERAEMEEPETLTPEDTGSKVAPGRKSGR